MKSVFTVQDGLDTADHYERSCDMKNVPPYLEQLCVLAQEVRRLREVCDDHNVEWEEGADDEDDVASEDFCKGFKAARATGLNAHALGARTIGKSYAQRMAAAMAKCREDILKAKAPTMVADFGPNGEISQIWLDEAGEVVPKAFDNLEHDKQFAKDSPPPPQFIRPEEWYGKPMVEPFVMVLHSDPGVDLGLPKATTDINDPLQAQDGTPGDSDIPPGTEDPMEAMRAIVKRYSLPD